MDKKQQTTLAVNVFLNLVLFLFFSYTAQSCLLSNLSTCELLSGNKGRVARTMWQDFLTGVNNLF